jgi:hypothetical protein
MTRYSIRLNRWINYFNYYVTMTLTACYNLSYVKHIDEWWIRNLVIGITFYAIVKVIYIIISKAHLKE